ncbi:hypothetical protein CEUSTIGMA_g6826.t1 [Chlamydomonas eustigma]|uniref:Thiol-disulfide oxidoreductase DCC n=1 Tax=Chlamydomonas eustigma TaxID=1157962 RepID=A0A250X8I3_9CHLO|nr:hypothetical protein CEUSTIGMA_g6826.t1 [Chlamydomonas eustigma]|eukprot:GAX79384.1 hypothetical protein CEUSTIGMA_g6826.t1 [Chlamydomonas eustigma]
MIVTCTGKKFGSLANPKIVSRTSPKLPCFALQVSAKPKAATSVSFLRVKGMRYCLPSVQLSAVNSTSYTVQPESVPSTSYPADDFANDRRPVILYDGVCNLCNGAVNLMLDLDPRGEFRMAALQSPAGRRLLQTCGRQPDDISSIVVVERGGKHHIKSDAILRIAQGLSNPFPLFALFGVPVPPFLRDSLYDLVADNRYSILGKRDVCRLKDDRFSERFIAE